MGVLLKYHWIIGSLIASSVLPYWTGKLLSLQGTLKPSVPVSDSTCDAVSESTCKAIDAGVLGHDKFSDVDDRREKSSPSNFSRSFPCCTVQQLLLSVWQQRDDLLTSLDALKDAAVELSKKLQLDIDLNLLQCSSSEGHNSEERFHFLRCLGPLRGRGYFSVSQWLETTPIEDVEHVTDNRPMQIDFYLPSGSIRSIQDVIDRVALHFSSPSMQSKPPHVVWFKAERGFRYLPGASPDDELSLDNPWVVDMSITLLKENKIYKKHVAHIETAFQKIDIYDTIDTHYDPFTFGPDAVDITPDREVYFDSIMQSRKRGIEAYHEALVHPLMLAHRNPQRVAIFGGGEGGTLREVLKYNTVVECVMIEIDEEIAQASRHVLRDWNDCSDLTGQGESGDYVSCYDDPRATLFFQDAIGWFIERFYKKQNVDASEKFDVIILDSLDPGSMLEFSDYMYGNLDFAKALRGALREGGILGGQVGIDKQDNLDDDHDWIRMVANLQKTEFYALKDYMEASCGFDDAWKFFVAPTDAHGLARWFSSTAQFDLEIARRAVPTRSGQSPFKYIDGATMASYQAPSRLTENLFCELVGEKNEKCKWGLENLREAVLEDGTSLMDVCNGENSALIMPSTLQLIRNTAGEVNVGSSVLHYGEDALLVNGQFQANESNNSPLGRGIFYNPSLHRHHLAAQNCQTTPSRA